MASDLAHARAGGRGREVQAAGGVVQRHTADGRVEVLLVHRPRYDDWTFPKGKAERGERPRSTARREVLEETGYVCTVGDEIAQVRYVDQRARPKVVRYFAMTVERGTFVANDEVDAIAWCTPVDASARLTHAHDVDVLRVAVSTRQAGSDSESPSDVDG